MVEGKDVRPTQPAKAEGIELIMYPLNPDGSWRNGIAPPQPQRTLRQVLDERRGQRPLGRVGEVLLSGRLLENHRELQQFAATETLKTLTIRQTLPEERRRIEVITSRNGGPGIIVRHIDGDQDSSENIVFLRGTRN